MEVHLSEASIGNSVLISPLPAQRMDLRVRELAVYSSLPSSSPNTIPWPLLKPLEQLELSVVLASDGDAAAAAGEALIRVEASLPSLTLLLLPSTPSLLLASHLDNLAFAYAGKNRPPEGLPHSPTTPPPPTSTPVSSFDVKLAIGEAAIWLHSETVSLPIARVSLRDWAVEVRGDSMGGLRVGGRARRVESHAAWRQGGEWVLMQQLGPVAPSCAAAALSATTSAGEVGEDNPISFVVSDPTRLDSSVRQPPSA